MFLAKTLAYGNFGDYRLMTWWLSAKVRKFIYKRTKSSSNILDETTPQREDRHKLNSNIHNMIML